MVLFSGKLVRKDGSPVSPAVNPVNRVLIKSRKRRAVGVG
jgi:hypothetical protein